MMTPIDNFLGTDYFNYLKDLFLNNEFPYYIGKKVLKSENPSIQFVHTFYRDGNQNSFYCEVLHDLFKLHKINNVIRAKLNISLPECENITYGMHVDYDIEYLNITFGKKNWKSGILYFSTTNGPTVFETKETIDCVENRFISFPVNTMHSGVSHTSKDKTPRIVLNLVYSH